MNDKEFREYFLNTLFEQSNQGKVKKYWSHTPDKHLDFYLTNILYERDKIDEALEQITADIINTTTDYAQWLIKHFDKDLVAEFFVNQIFHSHYYKEKGSFSLSAGSEFYDENMLTLLKAFEPVFGALPLDETLMLEYFNDIYPSRKKGEPELAAIACQILDICLGHTQDKKHLSALIKNKDFQPVLERHLLLEQTSAASGRKIHKV